MLPSNLAEVGTISIFSWLITAGGSLALAYAFARCGMLSRKPGGMGGYAEYAFGKAGNYMANYTYGLSLGDRQCGHRASPPWAMAWRSSMSTLTPHPDLPLDHRPADHHDGCQFRRCAHYRPHRRGHRLGRDRPGRHHLAAGLVLVQRQPPGRAAWNPHSLEFLPAVGSSISITLWAFLGLESACANADAVENPERDVPIAVLGGTIGAAIFYIVSTNVIAGIVPNADLAASQRTLRPRLCHHVHAAIGQHHHGADGHRLHRLAARAGSSPSPRSSRARPMSAISCRSSSIATKTGTPIVGMLILLAAQVALSLMTISPELGSQFRRVVDLAVVTNLVPYVMSMAALITIQNISGVPPQKALGRPTSSP